MATATTKYREILYVVREDPLCPGTFSVWIKGSDTPLFTGWDLESTRDMLDAMIDGGPSGK